MVRSVRNPADPTEHLVRITAMALQKLTGLTVLDKKTNLVVARRRGHRNLNVLQARRLSCRPVNTVHLGRRGRNSRHVKLEVAHLSVKDVGRDPVGVVRVVVAIVSIAVNQGNAAEARGRLDGWEIGWVSNDVGVVLINDGR